MGYNGNNNFTNNLYQCTFFGSVSKVLVSEVSKGLSPRVLSVIDLLLFVLLVSVLPFSSRLLQAVKAIVIAINKNVILAFFILFF